MRRILNFLEVGLLGIVLAGCASKPSSPAPAFMPKEGCVPNAETAIKIAVAVWEPIYGKDGIATEKPYHARLSNGVWFVEGSMPEPPAGTVMLGGVAEAEIRKDDGKILNVIHGQ